MSPLPSRARAGAHALHPRVRPSTSPAAPAPPRAAPAPPRAAGLAGISFCFSRRICVPQAGGGGRYLRCIPGFWKGSQLPAGGMNLELESQPAIPFLSQNEIFLPLSHASLS